MQKRRVRVRDEDHLRECIERCIEKDGPTCSLNHLDVSRVTSMYSLFESEYDFNGDVSEWDVSKVEWMDGMFHDTSFNGDLSKWNVSKVVSMTHMFSQCPFNGDLSAWNIPSGNACNMEGMFSSENERARVGLLLPHSMLDNPVQTLFSDTANAMHAWLASTPVCRYHWDAMLNNNLLFDFDPLHAPWVASEMREHFCLMRPMLEGLGLPPIDMARMLNDTWTQRHHGPTANCLPLPAMC